jgi:hypothetical protein
VNLDLFGMKMFTCNSMYFSELQWYSNFVLLVFLVSLVFFLLMSVSFGFVAFLATMALRPKMVVFVDDISEGSRDVPFENKILSQYGNWNPNKKLKFPYMHYDFMDRVGFITFTVTVRISQIKHHEIKLHVGSFV